VDYLLKDSEEARAQMVAIFRELAEKHGWRCGPVRTTLFLASLISRLLDEGVLTRAENQKSEKVV